MESMLSVRDIPESSKLQGAKNYAIWSFKVRTVLQGERVWNVVDPIIASITESTSSDHSAFGSGSGVDIGAINTSEGDTTVCKEKQAATPLPASHPTSNLEDTKYKAMRIIVPTVHDSIAPHIMHISDPRLVWIKLRDLYESKSMNRRLSIKSQLYSLRMTEKMNIEDLLCTVSDLTGQLANIGVVVPDEELVDRVLTSLPTSWDVLCQLATQCEHPITFAELEAMLLHEDSIRSRNREREEREEALVLDQEALYSRFNTRDNRQPTRGFAGRSVFRGHNSNNSGYNGSRGVSHFDRSGASRHHNVIGGRFGSGRHNFNSRSSDTTNQGACNECGSPCHWADRCELRILKNKVRELEMGSNSTSWRKNNYANAADTSSVPIPTHNNDEAALAEVFEICAAEVKQKARREEDWFLDSGATTHVTGNRDLLTDIRIAPKSNVTTVGGNALPVEGHGKATISDNKVVDNILYVPSMKKNLLSVGKFADQGMITLFSSRNCWIFHKHSPYKVILTGTRESNNSLYRLVPPRGARHAMVSHELVNLIENSASNSAHLWHKRTAHLNYQSLYNLSRNDMVRGIPPLPRIQPVCESCIMGKQHRHHIPKASTTSSTRPLQLVHSDLCGPFPQPSMTGSKYMLTFIDDYSRHCWVFFLATKNETFDSFKQFRRTVEKQI
jgi:hypothetical protein